MNMEVKLDLITSRETRYLILFEMVYFFIHFQIIGYLAAALRILQKLRRQNIDGVKQLSLNWLALGLTVFLIMWSADLVMRFVGQVIELPLMLYAGFSFLCMILYFVFANLAVYKSLAKTK